MKTLPQEDFLRMLKRSLFLLSTSVLEGLQGYALGYSMTEGDSVPAIRKKQAKSYWWVHSTRKTYPSAAGNINVKAGKEFHTYAYRQYFDAAPRKDISGNMYYHKLKDAWYIYLDYQKSVAGA